MARKGEERRISPICSREDYTVERAKIAFGEEEQGVDLEKERRREVGGGGGEGGRERAKRGPTPRHQRWNLRKNFGLFHCGAE